METENRKKINPKLNSKELVRIRIITNEVRKNTYPSLQNLCKSVENAYSKINQDNIGAVKERTIKRDIEAMRRMLGIDIEYSYTQRGYYIDEEQFDINGKH